MFRKIAKKILTKSPKTYTAIHEANFQRKHKQDFSNLNENEKSILSQINQNGYVVINDFMDKKICDNCIQDMDWMFENKKEFVHSSDYADHRIFGAEDLSKNIAFSKKRNIQTPQTFWFRNNLVKWIDKKPKKGPKVRQVEVPNEMKEKIDYLKIYYENLSPNDFKIEIEGEDIIKIKTK